LGYSKSEEKVSKFIPQRFNDLLALILIFGIVALWILQGINKLSMPSEVTGALIVTWTLIVQFYFRKAVDETTKPS
jgi:hypothetical protein